MYKIEKNMSKHIKKRIKNKHQHHEDMLRHKIEEEIHAKYNKRINYLVGANNELMRDLIELEKKYVIDQTLIKEGFENF